MLINLHGGGQETIEKGESKDNIPVSVLSNWMESPFIEIEEMERNSGCFELVEFKGLTCFDVEVSGRQPGSEKRFQFSVHRWHLI